MLSGQSRVYTARRRGSSSARTPSMKRSTARDDSSRKRSRIASLPSLSRACAPRASRSPPRSPRAERAASGVGSTQFRWANTSFRSSSERPSRTCSTGSGSHSWTGLVAGRQSRGRSCGWARARRARFRRATIRLALLEDLERAVDERACQRPDRAELARRRQLPSQCPAMRRPLAEQREHGPLARGEIAIAHHSTSTAGRSPSVCGARPFGECATGRCYAGATLR